MSAFLDFEGLTRYNSKIKTHITVEDNKIYDKYGDALSINDIDEICN
jgi:hemerythrin-like domain-containing protein